MMDVVYGIDYENNRISVNTHHNESIAKKIARLKLIEERINHGELIISLIFGIEGTENRCYVYSW